MLTVTGFEFICFVLIVAMAVLLVIIIIVSAGFSPKETNYFITFAKLHVIRCCNVKVKMEILLLYGPLFAHWAKGSPRVVRRNDT